LENNLKISIIGGTGKEGRGLAYRWLKAGYSVTIGSREKEKALQAVDELIKLLGDNYRNSFAGDINETVVADCDVAVLTIPYQFHKEMLESMKPHLKGKFLMDVSVPLVPPKVSVVHIPEEGSAALEAQRILGDDCKVISAFQNISFELLLSEKEIECDVFVCGVDKESRSIGLQLVKDAGLRGWDAGPLENSIIPEGLTSILIRINRQFSIHDAGVRVTGVDIKDQ